MKNKKISIKFILLTFVFCMISGVLGYFVTLKMDEARRGGEVNITFTRADTETYVIPNTNVLTKEKALEEWPYIFKMQNTGTGKGIYQLLIKDVEGSNISRDNLACLLLLDGKEVLSIEMQNIKDNVLYQGEILPNSTMEGKLYIWNTQKESADKDSLTYEYVLELVVIKSGGPGF